MPRISRHNYLIQLLAKQEAERLLNAPRCPSCFKPIDFRLKYPDPMSPAEDHILPKVLFGEGPRQWMHKVCNERKGTKLLPPMRVARRKSPRKAVRIPGWTPPAPTPQSIAAAVAIAALAKR